MGKLTNWKAADLDWTWITWNTILLLLRFCGWWGEEPFSSLETGLTSGIINWLVRIEREEEEDEEEEEVSLDSPLLFTQGGVSYMAQTQAEGVLNLSGCGRKKWQDSLKLPSVLLMDSSVDMAGLETS